MMILDIRTIVFSYVLTNIVCLAVMVLLWRQNRARIAGTTFWVLDYACQTAALLLIVLRGSIPDGASIVLANTLVIGGALLGYMGLLCFAGMRRPQMFNYIFLAVIACVHIYLTYVRPDVEARTLNTSIGLLVVTLQCAWLMLFRASPIVRIMGRSVGLIFAAYGLVSLARIMYYFVSPQTRADFFEPRFSDAASMMTFQLLFVALTYSLALMYNKRLHSDITAQEDKFSKAFHSSPYAVTITRLSDGRIIEVNRGFSTITGYQAQEVLGNTAPALHLWDSDEDRDAVLSELATRSSVRGREFQFRKKSGEKITGLFSAEILSINDEKCILSSINDITGRKITEEALRETKDYLENLFNYANAPIIVWDNRFCITKFNRAFERLSGRREADVLGCKVDLFFPAVTREQSLEHIKKTTTGDPWDAVEIEILHVDGSVRTLLWNSATIYLPDGKTVLSTIAQGHDITENRLDREEISRLNEALEQKVAGQTRELRDSQMALLNLVDDLNVSTKNITTANQSLEAVNKELAAFSYSVSHDLRAPLRSIDGFGSALLEDYGDTLNEEGKHYLQRIRKATQTMGQLIDDMLSLSRVTQSEFYRQDFDLSAMVHDIADSEQQKNPRGVVVDIQEGVKVLADQRMINIAMINMLDNAWKYTSKSEYPHIEFGAFVQNGETVIFVRDNGVGFDMAYVGKIFGAFQRLHRTEDFPGTGIGLATVQRIINRHGGRIWAEGEVGKGATFFFTLNE